MKRRIDARIGEPLRAVATLESPQGRRLTVMSGGRP